jgi:uncharacterized protein YceK
MNECKFILLATLIICSLSGCASDELRAQQRAEDQAMARKHAAERQVERATSWLNEASAIELSAQANLTDKQNKQQSADEELKNLLFPAGP